MGVLGENYNKVNDFGLGEKRKCRLKLKLHLFILLDLSKKGRFDLRSLLASFPPSGLEIKTLEGDLHDHLLHQNKYAQRDNSLNNGISNLQ